MAATRTLGVGIVGIGWVATQHITAFQRNPHTRVVYLCDMDEAPARARLEKAGIACPDARFTRNYRDLLKSKDVDIISIATPNHLHAEQAVAAAKAGKHILVEKPMGLTLKELARIRDAVRKAKVRTITSFELHYNPYLRFAKWLRESGWLGELRFARFQYLSRVTDWYAGWNWVRTKKMGGSHLLAAGCHAVDALRWCTGLEAAEVSAYHTRFTAGYEWPTSIIANIKLQPATSRRSSRSERRRVLGQIISSTDFQMPYAFDVEMMGDRATIRNDTILWNDAPFDLEAMRKAYPYTDVSFREDKTPTGAAAIRIVSDMPGSADVSHHPFQGEIDELIDCILQGRETHLSVFDGQKTMELCIAADMSADKEGRPVTLPLLKG